MAVASIWKRPLDLLMAIYFATHIPTSAIIDAQAVLPRQLFPSWATETLDWHIATNGDTLMRDMPAWFKGLVWIEIFIQLPFFFFATYAFIYGKNWIRIPALIYGVEVVTSMVAILGHILGSPEVADDKRQMLVAIYIPYLILPLMLVIQMALKAVPFSDSKAKQQ